jgi:hypothetical protein
LIIYDVQNRGDPSIIQVVIHVYLVFVVGAILLSPATVLNTIADGVDFHVQHVREVSHELYVEAWFSTHTKTVVSRPIDDFLVVRMVFSMSQVPAGGEGGGGGEEGPPTIIACALKPPHYGKHGAARGWGTILPPFLVELWM